MIEEIIHEYLSGEVPNIYARFPDTVPDAFTVYQRIDRGRTDHIDSCTVVFMSYGKTITEALRQDETVKDAVFAMSELPSVSRVELGGGGAEEDSANKLWRSESIFNFTYYEEV